MRINTLAVAAVIGGVYSGGFFLGFNYHRSYQNQLEPSTPAKTEPEVVPEDANPATNSLIYRFGLPSTDPTLHYLNHVVQYDTARRIPRWVAQTLTEDNLKGSANRKASNFKPDPNLSPLFRATNDDFKAGGSSRLSRGHMAPAGDCKADQKAMDQTFYLSNILPQNYENNAGFWNRLEMYCRDLTKRWEEVHVISGPAMRPTEERDADSGKDKKWIRYEVIGDNEVAVPTHLYKIVACVGRKDEDPSIRSKSTEPEMSAGAFLVPNEGIPWAKELADFQVPLEEAETIAGLNFFPKLDRGKAVDLCEADGCRLIKYNEFQLYLLSRDLGKAKTKEDIVSTWKKLQKKNLQPDNYFLELLESKMKALQMSKEDVESEQEIAAGG